MALFLALILLPIGCSRQSKIVESDGIRVTGVKHGYHITQGYKEYAVTFRATNLTDVPQQVRFRAGLVSEFRAKYATKGDIIGTQTAILQPRETQMVKVSMPYGGRRPGSMGSGQGSAYGFTNPYVEILEVEEANVERR